MDPRTEAPQLQEGPQRRADALERSKLHEDIAAYATGMSTNEEVAGEALSHALLAADKVVVLGCADVSAFMASAADLPQGHPIAPIAPSGTGLARDTDPTMMATSAPSTEGPGARSLARGGGTLVGPPRLQGDREEWGRLPPHEWHWAAILCVWHKVEGVFLKHRVSIAACVVAVGVCVANALAFSSGVVPVFASEPLSGWAALAVAGAVALAAWSSLCGSPRCDKASTSFWSQSGSDHQQRQQRQKQPQRPLRMRGWCGEAYLLRGVCFVLVVTSAYGFQPADKQTLKSAVEAWCSNNFMASVRFGDINTWDVRTCICTDAGRPAIHSPMTVANPCPSLHALLLSCRCSSSRT